MEAAGSVWCFCTINSLKVNNFPLNPELQPFTTHVEAGRKATRFPRSYKTYMLSCYLPTKPLHFTYFFIFLIFVLHV